MKIAHHILAAVVMVVIVALTATTLPTQAQTLSPGCQFINDVLPNPSFWNMALGTNMDFYAGETLTLTPIAPQTYAIVVPRGGARVAMGTGTLNYTFPADVTLDVFFELVDHTGSYSVTCGILPSVGTVNEFGQIAGIPCQGALDGRINSVAELDCAPPFAIYNEGDYFAVYGVNPETGEGALVVRVMKADIGAAPAENALLADGVNVFTGQPVTVWHLSSGEIQVNATYADGKPYIFTFDADGNLIAHLAA